MQFIISESIVPNNDADAYNEPRVQFAEDQAHNALAYVAERMQTVFGEIGGLDPIEDPGHDLDFYVLGFTGYDQEKDQTWFIQLDYVPDDQAESWMSEAWGRKTPVMSMVTAAREKESVTDGVWQHVTDPDDPEVDFYLRTDGQIHTSVSGPNRLGAWVANVHDTSIDQDVYILVLPTFDLVTATVDMLLGSGTFPPAQPNN